MKFGVVYNSLFSLFVEYHVMSNRFFCLVILFDAKCLLDGYLFYNSPIYIVNSRLV